MARFVSPGGIAGKARGIVRPGYTFAGPIRSQLCCGPARCEFNLAAAASCRRANGEQGSCRLSFRALGQALMMQLPRGSNLQKHRLKYASAFPALGRGFVAGSRRIPGRRFDVLSTRSKLRTTINPAHVGISAPNIVRKRTNLFVRVPCY